MSNPSQTKEIWSAEDIAYLRTFSDISFSEEIAVECGAQAAFYKDEMAAGIKLTAAPRIELRFKAATKLLGEALDHGIKNVLEIAAGLSPRGLILTGSDSELKYTEVDLPAQISKKEQCVNNILTKHRAFRPNLTFAPVDVLSDDQLAAIGKTIRGPIAVVSEGVRPLIREFAEKVHGLLVERGGVWITPDLVTRDEWSHSLGGSVRTQFGFESKAEIGSFLDTIGFRPERFLQLELVSLQDLTSIGNAQLGLNTEEQAGRLRGREIYRLYPK